MPRTSALVLEPGADAASALAAAVAAECVAVERARTGDEGWRALGERRPDIVFLSLATPGLDVFFRRLRDEYMGVHPRLIGVADASDLVPSVSRMDLEAVLLSPVSAAAFTAMFAKAAPVVGLDPGRLREMVRLSCLGGGFQDALNAAAKRLTLVYGVGQCVVVATAGERQWVGSVGEPIASEHWPQLWQECDQAVTAGAPLVLPVSPRGDTATAPAVQLETRLAAPLRAPTGSVLGAICLMATGARLFTNEARDALAELALRLGSELSWRSIHDRVAAERDRLRESAMLDPMLAIHSRAALEQALATELGRFRRTREMLSVSVIDIAGLREINDRYGHVIGDAALRHVADTARRLVRAQDIVGRYGGDEIAVVLPSTDMGGARHLADRMRHAIESAPFAADGMSISIGVTVGLAECSIDDTDGGALLARAAGSAYAAKQAGDPVGVAGPGAAAEVRPPVQERFEAGVTLAGMYQIAHEISRGAMGVVYRAEDLGLSRPVAIKMLRPDLLNDKELVTKFRQEAGILASLNHPNLVRVYAFVVDKEDVFFVMELVEGVSLDGIIHEFLDAETFLPVARVHAIVANVASALDAMHDAGVMHRDVKPGNIVLDRARDRAVLVDVGLAQRFGQRGEPGGTPGFIAPESFRGGPETPATDVYGLAATTYTLLVGRAPFGRSDDYREILRRQVDERPPLPSSFRSDLPTDLDLVLLRALAVDPKDRYATAGEFARELGLSIRTVAGAHAPIGDAIDFGDGATPAFRRADSMADTRRTLTLDLDLVPPAAPHPPLAMTRGIVFRGAARVLGLNTAIGSVRGIARSNGALADALSLRTSPMGWLPATLFTELLAAVAASGRNAESFARQLGTTVVAQTFQRFYPSSPEGLSPAPTLSAVEILWRKYHTWGSLAARPSGANGSVVGFDGPTEPGCCAFIEGWLGQVVAMSGGTQPRIEHTVCRSKGAGQCEFSVRWGL